jgi:hypothetical protein
MAQHEIAVLLQEPVLASITPARDRIREMLRTIDLDDDSRVDAQEIDFPFCPSAVLMPAVSVLMPAPAGESSSRTTSRGLTNSSARVVVCTARSRAATWSAISGASVDN